MSDQSEDDDTYDHSSLKVIDMSHYTDKMWCSEIKEYLIKCYGMNENQIAYEMEKHFPDLFETQKAELNLLI
jgi:hypothetical protein